MSRSFHFYPEYIPHELKGDDVWVCCDEEKVPHIPLAAGRLRRASSTNPETWRSYDEAEAALATGRYWGIGRIITAQGPYVGVDLDGCRDPVTRRIAPWAWKIAEHLNSYTEVSPSLTGIKVWIKAELAQSKTRTGLEIYRGAQYFTTTGMFLSQFPLTVERRQAELEAILAEEFPVREKRKRRRYSGPQEALDLDAFLEQVEVVIIAERRDHSAELKYQIVCPWISEHTVTPETGTYVGQYESGALFFRCYHAHCAERAWLAFLDEVSTPVFTRNGTRRSVKVYAKKAGGLR
jgi:hypothetical protein